MKTASRSCLPFASNQNAGTPSPDLAMSSWSFNQHEPLALNKPLGSSRSLGLQTVNMTNNLTQRGPDLDPHLTKIRPTPLTEVGQHEYL